MDCVFYLLNQSALLSWCLLRVQRGTSAHAFLWNKYRVQHHKGFASHFVVQLSFLLACFFFVVVVVVCLFLFCFVLLSDLFCLFVFFFLNLAITRHTFPHSIPAYQ